MQINTYPEMNEKIKDILRIGASSSGLYAAQRIEDLEKQVEQQQQELEQVKKDYEELADGTMI